MPGDSCQVCLLTPNSLGGSCISEYYLHIFNVVLCTYCIIYYVSVCIYYKTYLGGIVIDFSTPMLERHLLILTGQLHYAAIEQSLSCRLWSLPVLQYLLPTLLRMQDHCVPSVFLVIQSKPLRALAPHTSVGSKSGMIERKACRGRLSGKALYSNNAFSFAFFS